MIDIYNREDFTKIDNFTENCWINIYPPFDHQAIQKLAEQYDIYIEYFTDAFDIYEQSRFEVDGGTKFILINSPIKNDNLIDNKAGFITFPISIIIKDKVIITTSLLKNPVIESLFNRRKKSETYIDINELIIEIFEKNIAYYLFYLKQINLKYNEIEKKIDSNTKNKNFITLLHLKKSLIYFETNLRTNNLMLVKMKRTNFLKLEDSILEERFDEILIENLQAIDMTEVYSRIMENSMTTISSMINNNVNLFMKRLTGVTVMLMVPSLISGLYGMNVPLPFHEDIRAFYFLLVLSFLISSIMGYIFFKNEWGE
ncbi:MAG: magnesium transporter CorA family protein [Chitinophagales bacterium]|nr:magnesium transporter CorA family protein [Chitinophagales bacterium]